MEKIGQYALRQEKLVLQSEVQQHRRRRVARRGRSSRQPPPLWKRAQVAETQNQEELVEFGLLVVESAQVVAQEAE